MRWRGCLLPPSGPGWTSAHPRWQSPAGSPCKIVPDFTIFVNGSLCNYLFFVFILTPFHFLLYFLASHPALTLVSLVVLPWPWHPCWPYLGPGIPVGLTLALASLVASASAAMARCICCGNLKTIV